MHTGRAQNFALIFGIPFQASEQLLEEVANIGEMVELTPCEKIIMASPCANYRGRPGQADYGHYEVTNYGAR